MTRASHRVNRVGSTRRWRIMVPSHERIAMRAWTAVTVLGLGLTAAHAGPCSEKIAQFEQAVRQSAGNPNAGPMARQTIGAQLNRQPTLAAAKRMHNF